MSAFRCDADHQKVTAGPAAAEVRGQLPVTTTGYPSYSLAKARIKEKADELLWALQDEYGLTDLEMADVLSDVGHSFLRGAVSDQQEGNPARAATVGTPLEDDLP